MSARPLNALRPLALAVQIAMTGIASSLAWSPDAIAQGTNAAAQTTVRSYSIAPGPLTVTVNRFAETAGIYLTAPAALTQGKTSPGLQGSFGIDAGFDALLAGTGLQAVRQADGAYALQARPAGGAEVSTLPAVMVSAGSDHRVVTEHTGAYTVAGPVSTATGLALTPRETPQSTTIISRQRIEDQGMRTAEDALVNTTGIGIYQGDSERSLIYARGFVLSNYAVDGVAYTGSNSFSDQLTSLAIYDRMEIVRGPTGLVSSFGDPAGTINLVRKRASSRELTGTASLSYGRWNTINPTLDLSTPLNESGSVRGRFVADYISEDSFLDRVERDRQLFYGTVEADLTDRTTVILGTDYNKGEIDGATFGAFPSRFANGNPVRLPRSTSSAPRWSYWNNDRATAFGRIEHRLDNGWHVQTGLQYQYKKTDESTFFHLNRGLDEATGLGLQPLLNKTNAANREAFWNASAGGPFSLFGREHELNLALSASRKWARRSTFSGEAAPIGSIYDWKGDYPEPAVWRRNASSYAWRKDISTVSASATGRFSIVDDLHLITGGRLNDWKNGRRHFREFTPYLGATYDLDSTYTAYASYAELFNPQNFRTQDGTYLDPMVGKGYEAGLKAEYLDGRVLASLSVFKTLQDNVGEVIDGGFVLGSSERAYRSVSGISTRGVELDMSGELTPGWNVGLGVSVARSENRFGDAFNPHIPDQTVKLYTSYRLPDAWNKLTVGGGLRWQNQTWRNFNNAGVASRFDAASVTVVDLMARYDFDRTWSAQLNISNLFDRHYYTMTGQEVHYGQPRNVSLRVSAHF